MLGPLWGSEDTLEMGVEDRWLIPWPGWAAGVPAGPGVDTGRAGPWDCRAVCPDGGGRCGQGRQEEVCVRQSQRRLSDCPSEGLSEFPQAGALVAHIHRGERHCPIACGSDSWLGGIQGFPEDRVPRPGLSIQHCSMLKELHFPV